FFKAAAVTGNPSNGDEITFDSEVVWAKVYEIGVWTNGTTYAAGSFVQFEEQLYYTAAGGTANDGDSSDGVTIEGDTVVSWTAVESTWQDSTAYSVDDIISDDGMLFRATTAGTSNGTGVWDDSGVNWVRLNEGVFEMVTATNIADVMASIGAATGDEYNSPGLYLQIESVGGVQSHVPVFIASGNLLNWASASKFDIQKKILTGGKYDANEQHLVSQGRGCSSSGFVKEVIVTDSGGVDSVLTLSVEGPGPDNWIDSTDFTTRISILGVTADGFADSPRAVACQTAIEEIAKGALGNLGIISTNIDVCLAYSGTNNVLAESNAAYNHSVFTCWKIVESGYTVPDDLGNVSEITNACEGIYAEVNPPSIDTENSGYPCYGVYNQTIPDARIPTGTGSGRIGYVGRCWEPGSFPAGCAALSCTGGQPVGTGNPRCYPDGFQYECSGNYNIPQDTCNKPWVMILQDTVDPTDPACPAGSTAAPGGWTDDLNPNTGEECVQEAIWDYCKGLGITEVIDPSDLVFNTTETWGLVGALVDSGIMSMFEKDRPLSVMKGYIAQTTAPEGILHDVAGDLRLGVMAFNDNGAETECAAADPTDNIVQHCPGTNKDGAKLIAPIKSGVEVTDDKGTATTADDVTHVDDLTVAVNAVEATAWTPLAEAVYNAIGYYGQNTSYRLHADDFVTEAEGGAADPVQFWCQENNILIITEGASTADVHPDVANLVKTIMPGLSVEDSSVAAVDEEECLDSDGNNLLFGSTYLD
ncbi:MAG: hypothetical protein KAQ71_07205, partial [Desulfobulbaceae bacterium]|nr:hypothetical protein [Desulfobulbaceae bacterium]